MDQDTDAPHGAAQGDEQVDVYGHGVSLFIPSYSGPTERHDENIERKATCRTTGT